MGFYLGKKCILSTVDVFYFSKDWSLLCQVFTCQHPSGCDNWLSHFKCVTLVVSEWKPTMYTLGMQHRLFNLIVAIWPQHCPVRRSVHLIRLYAMYPGQTFIYLHGTTFNLTKQYSCDDCSQREFDLAQARQLHYINLQPHSHKHVLEYSFCLHFEWYSRIYLHKHDCENGWSQRWINVGTGTVLDST